MIKLDKIIYAQATLATAAFASKLKQVMLGNTSNRDDRLYKLIQQEIDAGLVVRDAIQAGDIPGVDGFKIDEHKRYLEITQLRKGNQK